MEQATIHPAALAGSRVKPRGVFEQLANPERHKRNLPVYHKLHCIGRGAFGKAYLVEVGRSEQSETPPQQRVLKKLPLSDITEAQRESAYREAMLMRRISRNCPFITQFAEVLLCKGGAVLCIVMEFCSGGDLRQSLRDRDGQLLPEEQVLDWAAQIALALHHCHSRGVLHRDVKPENCFFRTKGGDLLLGDFGISCTLDEQHFAKTCCGSPLYLSPEIVNQEKYNYASDVWSLGVVLYEMAQLKPPFKGTNICQVAFKIVSATPEALDSACFSAALQGLVDRLLEKDASVRVDLDKAMRTAPFQAAVACVASRHRMLWPPPAQARGPASGLVQRLRKTAGYARADSEEYADDFEAYDGEDDDEVDYQDDFEEASSDGSYEQDFEVESDAEPEGSERPGLLHDISEDALRNQIREELGDEMMSIAEGLGVVSFLEGMRRSQQR